MRKRILNHLDLKMLSLIIAILIWITVANVDDYKTTRQITGIEIEFINGSAITEKNKVYEVPEGTTVDVVVKGPRSIVEGLSKDDFHAIADLSKMSITNAVDVEVTMVNSHYARELTIVYTNNAINIEVEDKVEKQLPIVVHATSAVKDGYAISSKTVTPNLITVKGAESIVNTINEVYVEVDVSGADHDIVAYGKPIFADYAGGIIDSAKFEYDVESAEVTVTIKKTKELKVNVKTSGEVKEGYQISSIDYQPTSVVVVGEPENLGMLEQVIIDNIDVEGCDKDFEVTVNLADYLPSGIVIADETEAIMIKVGIEQLQEKTFKFDYEDINVVGKNDEYNYEFLDDKGLTIVVKGLADNLSDIKASDLLPSIDVTDYKPGQYTFDLNIRKVNGITVEEKYQVEMIIKSE